MNVLAAVLLALIALELWLLNGRLSELTDALRVVAKEAKGTKTTLDEIRTQLARRRDS